MRKNYSQEMREQTVAYYLESGKSITSVAKELGIGINTLCRWVNDYKEAHGIESDSRKPASNQELYSKVKELEKQLKEKDKELARQKKKLEEEQMKVEILKKSLHIFMEPDA